ncbi:MAG: hypothetical protein HOO88_05300 [Kiritimatiellaceae bacterium]|nr:hypothetical protein [Kiritimatiellaceae bacterium]
MKISIRTLLAGSAIAFSLSVSAESIWIESESIPEKPAAASTGWSKPEWLSGKSTLTLNLAAKDVAATIPEDGLILKYPFTVKTSADFTLWNRLAFENNRTPFEWRVDNGSWQINSQKEQPVCNVQELAFWSPIGWSRMGSVPLNAGSHTLEIRLTRPKKSAEKNSGDLRYISDAIHITSEEFQPNFRFKPGEKFQNEAALSTSTNRFSLPAENAASPRRTLDLTGLWQFAPYDEIGEISEASRVAGTDIYPDVARLSWYGIPVPGDRNSLLPETRYAHRFVLRTQVNVPADAKNNGFQLEFECLSMISTLFVNGQKIGDFSVPKSRWLVDVTQAVKPGAANEILLVVKDTYYAIAPSKNNGTIRRTQYLPDRLFNGNQGTTSRMDFPVANGHDEAGILDTARLIATRAPVAVVDTFVKPFPITKKKIDFDVTLHNSGSMSVNATLRLFIRSWPEGKTVATVGETKLFVPVGGNAATTLETPSAPLTLWWTFQPALYELVTEVSVNGQPADTHITRFGNREWEIRGNKFYLNGVAQHLRADLTYESVKKKTDPAVIVKTWKEIGVNMFRRRFQFPWNGMGPNQTLAWMDEVGMPVRMNGGTFDGQVGSYGLVEGSGKGKERSARKALFERWRSQMLNGVNTFKNHPSVFIWELDNEIVYINSRNFGTLDQVEPEFTTTAKAVAAMDPTRSTVLGGARALRDESMPTYGIHYFETEDRDYPDEAYTGDIALKLEGSDKKRTWPVHFDAKPIFFSETAFLPGRNPAQFSAVGGETTFLGKYESRFAAGKIASWLAEGYRWKGYAANHFWFGKDFTDGSYTYAWQPVAILHREWNATFAPGQAVTRSLRVYNDLPDTRPITATWTLEVGGKSVTTESKNFTVAPGTFEPWNIQFTMPASAAERTEGRLLLTAVRAGEKVFEHALPVTLIPDPKPAAVSLKGTLVVWDPKGTAVARLRASGFQQIKEVSTLAEVPDQFGLLVVGKNALSQKDSTDRRWQALAAAGNKIIVLEQEYPLHFQAVPADFETTDHDGRISFAQNLEHPVFKGLRQDDLSFWGSDHIVYRHALRKPTRGAVSLVQCDDQLGDTALAVAEVDKGLLVMSQLAIGEKLTTEVVCRRLFDNLIAYAAGYQKVVRSVQTTIENPQTAAAISAVGVSSKPAADPVAALKSGGIVIVDGTKANLEKLGSAAADLAAFFAGGNYLMVINVTPDSLAAFNKLVGYEHVLRPFRQELVRFPVVPNPLTAGLTLRDVVMTNGKRFQVFNRDEWPADDAFDYIADLDDIAPFAEFPSPDYFGFKVTGPGTDQWPLNMVNGFTHATHWKLAFSIWVGDGVPKPFTLTLPKEETVTGFTIIPTRTYLTITKLRLTFDGNPATAQELTLSDDPISNFQLKPQRASKIEIGVLEWTGDSQQPLVGIDNINITVARPADFTQKVRPMLNIGGLIEYPRGKGGIILNQYVFRPQESNPVNAEKKRTLLASLLRNLGADFGGQKTAVAGFNLVYQPLSLEGAANLYLTTVQGWSAKGGDLSGLPRGENTFAGVRYQIRDFSTSPLESGVTLKHPKLKSNAESETVTIPVNTKADSLFFLHTFLQTKEWKSTKNDDEAPVLFQYVVSYEDGTKLPIEITLNSNVSNWLQANPSALSNAEAAWIGPAASEGGSRPTLYQFQWNNPQPAKQIVSVELSYAEKGKDFGAPVLLGLTTAQVQK